MDTRVGDLPAGYLTRKLLARWAELSSMQGLVLLFLWIWAPSYMTMLIWISRLLLLVGRCWVERIFVPRWHGFIVYSGCSSNKHLLSVDNRRSSGWLPDSLYLPYWGIGVWKRDKHFGGRGRFGSLRAIKIIENPGEKFQTFLRGGLSCGLESHATCFCDIRYWFWVPKLACSV